MIRKAKELVAKDGLDLAKIRLSFQEKVSVLKILDSEVVDLVGEDEVADEIEQADTYMEDVYATMAKLDQLASKILALLQLLPPGQILPVMTR
jgi:erythromycin esterase-like protein